ncbi:uncharacterized protein LOC143296211 [Babylonia areolata]|uniref:uncharacterized protein LOC143296211 n=1 Tax=Babylonia areolata TaxID=304850 RepID=UPI003FD3E45F
MEGGASQADQMDNFKPVFKKYKRRDQPLDLTDVIDLENLSCSSSKFVQQVKPVIPSLTPVVGLKPVQDWSIFHFPNHPGFYLVQNPFLPGSQRYWAGRCLKDLPRRPHLTNLTIHPDLDPDMLWDTFLSLFHTRGGEAYSSSSPLRKLRWTTIGYHHNWDTKEYSEDAHTPFPSDLWVLSHYVAAVLGFPGFRAEAGIINYYHHDSCLAAHTDHSELDHKAPLLSFSFGQDAIFLLGGVSKALMPTAVRLHSGDVCVMSGDARLAFHAVPRILPPSIPPPPCHDLTPHLAVSTDCWLGAFGDMSADTPGGRPADRGDVPGYTLADKVDNMDAPCDRPGDGKDTAGDTPGDSRDTPCVSIATPVDSRDTPCVSIATPVDSRDTPGDTPGDSRDTPCVSIATPGDSRDTPCVSIATPVDSRDTPCVSIATPVDSRDTPCDTPGDSRDSGRGGDTPDTPGDVAEQPPHGSHPAGSYEDRVQAVNRRVVTTVRGEDWRPLAVYLSSSRLNINIRQVLKDGHTFHSAPVHDQHT